MNEYRESDDAALVGFFRSPAAIPGGYAEMLIQSRDSYLI